MNALESVRYWREYADELTSQSAYTDAANYAGMILRYLNSSECTLNARAKSEEFELSLQLAHIINQNLDVRDFRKHLREKTEYVHRLSQSSGLISEEKTLFLSLCEEIVDLKYFYDFFDNREEIVFDLDFQISEVFATDDELDSYERHIRNNSPLYQFVRGHDSKR